MEIVQNKKNINRKIILFISIGAIVAFYFLFIYQATNKNKELKYINKNYTLVETTTIKILPLNNYDVFDYYIENSTENTGEYTNVYIFNKEENKDLLSSIFVNNALSSKYKGTSKN